MFVKLDIVAAVAVALVAAGSTFAGDNNKIAIKGKVMGDDGKPAPDAEIRVKALDRKEADKIALTNSQGQYIVVGLPVGRYSVTAYDWEGNPRSRAIIKVDRKGWAKVNFDLKLDQDLGNDAGRIAGQDPASNANSHLNGSWTRLR
jgi:Carboxypeptidase regulatory-like domain